MSNVNLTAEAYTIPFQGHELHARVFRPAAPAIGRIFYLHGGGLVFGEPDDLPLCYVNLFLNAGYELISLDYPLAPEQGLAVILEAVHAGVMGMLEILGTCADSTGSSHLPYYLFGRSAGAYLALMEAKRLCGSKSGADGADALSTESTAPAASGSCFTAPSGLLCFYGYHTFDLPEFKKPNAWFTKLPAVSKQTVDSLIQTKNGADDTTPAFLTSGPMATRYSIYIYARQNGCWPELLGTPEDIARYSLSEEDFALLPPGFFTASSGDQDVPFRESKQMARKISGSKFFPVYYLEHDFDRDTSKSEGMQAYQAALAWLKEHETA